MVSGRILFVTYTYRGEKIRIISARKAEPHEQRKYYQNYP
ncbi:MAG: BrnT family toxin [Candidatus Poribacteria bacterium]|nr:BrnT family toxin [Candidatus Poribacteria bacterium]